MRQTINVMRQEGGKVVRMPRPTAAAECRAQIAVNLWRAADYRRLGSSYCFSRFERESHKAQAKVILRLTDLLRRGLADHLRLIGRQSGSVLP